MVGGCWFIQLLVVLKRVLFQILHSGRVAFLLGKSSAY